MNQPVNNWRNTIKELVVFDQNLMGTIKDGFGPQKDGEDPFDAFVGVCSMIDVVLGNRTEGTPCDEVIILLKAGY